MALVSPRAGTLFGGAAVAVWIGLYLVAVALTPGYSIPGNALSDLGNPSARAPWAFNAANILSGLLFLPFAWSLGDGLPGRTRLVGSTTLTLAALTLVLVGVFPEESLYNLHFLFSILFFVLVMVTTADYAVGFGRSRVHDHLSGLLSAVVAAFALSLLVDGALYYFLQAGSRDLVNELEHAAAYAALVWAAWNAYRLRGFGRAGQPG